MRFMPRCSSVSQVVMACLFYTHLSPAGGAAAHFYNKQYLCFLHLVRIDIQQDLLHATVIETILYVAVF